MPEGLAGQDPLAAPPALGEPGTSAPDIESIKAEIAAQLQAQLDAKMNERVAGFQRLVSERDTEIRTLRGQLEEARLSALPDDEREEEESRKREEEFERLRAENELLRLMPEYPDELPLFQKLISAPDAKTQLSIIRELRTPATPAPAPAASEEDGLEPAPVDPNNPPRSEAEGLVLSDGTVMTDDLADRLLKSVPRLRR